MQADEIFIVVLILVSVAIVAWLSFQSKKQQAGDAQDPQD